jgi:hypothetical protein
MADVTLVQGDTRPPVVGTLRVTSTQALLDLTTASGVKFQMRQDNDRHYTVDADADIVSAASGAVSYDWEEGDLNVPGEYIAQWEITWSDDTVQTTDPPNTILVRRQ